MLGHLTNLDNCRVRAYCACSGGWGGGRGAAGLGWGGGKLCLNVNLFNFFLSPVISIFFSSSV